MTFAFTEHKGQKRFIAIVLLLRCNKRCQNTSKTSTGVAPISALGLQSPPGGCPKQGAPSSAPLLDCRTGIPRFKCCSPIWSTWATTFGTRAGKMSAVEVGKMELAFPLELLRCICIQRHRPSCHVSQCSRAMLDLLSGDEDWLQCDFKTGTANAQPKDKLLRL